MCKFIHLKHFIPSTHKYIIYFKKGPCSQQQIDFTRVEPHHKLYMEHKRNLRIGICVK